ncbi:MAG: hypothetical protein QF570_15170 [Myxococcota bacterium]|jgi:hypothetical protein|nr:hypothetical protein [Myxococcota bacterium]
MFHQIIRTTLSMSTLFTLLFAGSALAQDAEMNRAERRLMTDDVLELEEVEVSRPVDELPNDVEPVDPDSTDTALVFSNLGGERARVKCVAFNMNGRPVGRTRTAIPALGVRYMRASDISNGLDFVGQVHCASHGKVVGSTVFVGRGITDLPVRNGHVGRTRIRFPLVAHY